MYAELAWLNYGERKWGQTYAGALDPARGKYDTLNADARVARRVKLGKPATKFVVVALFVTTIVRAVAV